jgi:hypothetical protein
VRRDQPGLFVILRHFDGAWQRTVWVRQIGTDWSVNRPEHKREEVTEDLSSGVESGIIPGRIAFQGGFGHSQTRTQPQLNACARHLVGFNLRRSPSPTWPRRRCLGAVSAGDPSPDVALPTLQQRCRMHAQPWSRRFGLPYPTSQ